MKVTVTFEVNNECLLKVTAREQTSGIEVMSIFTTRDNPEAVKAKLGPNHPNQPEAPPLARRQSLSGMPAAGGPHPKPTAAPHVPLRHRRDRSGRAPGGLVGWLKRIIGRA